VRPNLVIIRSSKGPHLVGLKARPSGLPYTPILTLTTDNFPLQKTHSPNTIRPKTPPPIPVPCRVGWWGKDVYLCRSKVVTSEPMDTPTLETAQQNLGDIDPAQLDDATKIAFVSAVAQIATANASLVAGQSLHKIAEASGPSLDQARRLVDDTTDLVEAVKALHQ
jgi:hypothetical protein